MTNKGSNDPYLHAPTHGGSFDPNAYINQPSGQTKNTNASHAWATAPTHGGDFDPNQFDASHLPGQSQGRQSNRPAMASDAVQGGSYGWDSAHYSDRIVDSSNPTRRLLDPNSIPMETLRDGSGVLSRQMWRESSEALLDSSTGNNPAAPPASITSHSLSVGPTSSQSGSLEKTGFGGRYKSQSDERPSQVLKRKSNSIFYHRDFLKRSYTGRRDDRLLNPKHGRPSKLIIQCSEEVLNNNSEATWARTQVLNKSPWLFRLSFWATGESPIIKWLPACVMLTFVMLSPVPVTTKTRNDGFFEPLLYKDWQYPYDARNQFENPPSRGKDDRGPQTGTSQRSPDQPLIGKTERISEPDYLCLEDGMQIINVPKWRAKHGKEAKLEYVLVSYTSRQFSTEDDKYYLNKVGQQAARAAHVEAYWLGCSCLGATTAEREQSVWRICDVIRGAFSVVIAVSGRVDFPVAEGQPHDLLNEWSRRVWTLPELLLSPERDDIAVYTRDEGLDSSQQIQQIFDSRRRQQIHRRNFPRFSDDHSVEGQLIDHYEGSVILSPLELVTTALLCLQHRQTTEYFRGDLSYTLMGLLRQRPHVRRDDSAFQAFARLSLANDSNMLLERLVCLLPQSPKEPWHSLHDHWGASLWDIYPKTQVCGIGENDSVILDGARAASIRWKSFKHVILRGNDTVWRKLARFAISLCSVFLVGGIIMEIVFMIMKNASMETEGDVGGSDPIKIIGAIFIAVSLAVILLSPQLIQFLYFGKVWSAQPWFFGVEGYMNLADLERHLLGADRGRLSWSATGSSLSRHKIGDSQEYHNFCEGQDPSTYRDINTRIQQARKSSGDEEKIFMLVDTYTMTVTLFSAIKPPVAVLACGEEGGMQRALLCSYEWTNNTLYRETVLRMETPAYWRMSPVGRVRLGLQTRRRLDV